MKKVNSKVLAVVISLLVAMMYTFTPSGTAFADEEDEMNTNSEILLEIGGKVIVEEITTYTEEDDTVETVVHKENLPAGVSFEQVDQDKSILTLNNATINTFGGDTDSYIFAALKNLEIVLKGSNTFADASARYGVNGIYYYNAHYDDTGNLLIRGDSPDASLTINMLKGNSSKMGLVGKGALSIENCTINFNAATGTDGYIYGISMHPETNYMEHSDTEEELQVSLKDATIHISGEMPQNSDSYNVGIDSQDSNLNIQNSKVDINMTGGIGLGLGVGLFDEFYSDDEDDWDDDDDWDDSDDDWDDSDDDWDDSDDGWDEDDDWDEDDEYLNGKGLSQVTLKGAGSQAKGAYGGIFKIDNKSSVSIKLNKCNEEYLEDGWIDSIYYYNNDEELAQYIKSPFIYSSNMDSGKGTFGKTPLREQTWIEQRYECTKRYLEFSPYKINLNKTSFTYNKKAKKPGVKVTDASGNAVANGVTYSNNKNAGIGTALITVNGAKFYRFFSIAKAAQKMTVKAKTATVKYSKLKKATQNLAVKKVLTIKKATGTKTFKKLKGKSKIKVNKKTGKVTVKKGLKKGTYKVKVNVKAAGNNNFKAKSKTVTFKIKVK